MTLNPYQLVLSKIADRNPIPLGDHAVKFCCFCHEDSTPSATARESDDGKVLLHCFGCKATASDMVAAMGLKMSDLFLSRDTSRHDKADRKQDGFPSAYLAIKSCYERKLGKPAMGWDYHDASGKVIARQSRFNMPNGKDKEFRPVSIETDGKWYPKAPEPRPLYNLPEVMKAVAAGVTVYVFEGEKAADAVRPLGLVATTSMNGAKSPKKTDWSPLSGANVVIWRDNDEPGEDYCKIVTEILRPMTPPATVRSIVTGTEKGDDAFDWVAAHGDAAEPETMRAEIETMVAAAPQAEKSPSLFKIFSAGDLVRDYPTLREPIIDGILRRGETMNIIAAPKTGKSWLSMGLALTVAAGWQWLGRFQTAPNTVLIVDNELHPETLSFRLKWLADQMQVDPAIWQDKIHVASVRGRGLDLKAVAAELSSKKYGMTILDAWYRFQPVGSNENSNSDVTALYNILDGLPDTSKVCIHHTSKGDQSGKANHEVGSGAGAQSRAPDCHMTLRPHEEHDAIVVTADVRSFPRMHPFCLRLEHPLWVYDANLDPSKLKTSKPTKQPEIELGIKEEKERLARDKDRETVLAAYSAFPSGETVRTVREAIGFSGSRFSPINLSLLQTGHIKPCKVKKGPGTYDGFCLVGQVGQVGQSHPSHSVGQPSSSLEDGVVPPYSGHGGRPA